MSVFWKAGIAVGLVVAGILVAARLGSGKPSKEGGVQEIATPPWGTIGKPTKEVLAKTLDPLQYRVTQEDGTEPAFNNTYWNHHEAGIYVDVVSGEPLFASTDKFDSGTGWPSFTKPLMDYNVTEHGGSKMWGIEVRSKHGDSHLGHVFDDGPEPTGLRYCINSAALRFIPAADLEAEGYGEFAALFATSEIKEKIMTARTEVATLAGGCFWGMEDILRDIPGVLDTEAGYTGGHVADATYGDVKTGKSGHAESVRIVFDPDKIRYEEILGYFFRMHDPTTMNRQGNDRGTQYRSAIFYHDDAQRATAERVKAEVNASGKWKSPIVTEIVPAGAFYKAEDYHQDYLEKYPDGYTCHYLRD